jgi:nicotinamide mononucleotide transporter
MLLADIFQQFMTGLQQTRPLEFVGVIAGIVGVWFNSKENILGIPDWIGEYYDLYLSQHKRPFIGEASVNFYYTDHEHLWLDIMGTERQATTQTHPAHNLQHQKRMGSTNYFFAAFYTGIYFALTWAKQAFAPEAIPWADAFASATAYTGMWLMTKKKIESWYWWFATNIVSVPLYFTKGYVFTSVQFAVLFIINIFGLLIWIRKEREYQN